MGNSPQSSKGLPIRGWETGGRADLGLLPDPQPHTPWELWFLFSISGNCACKYFSLESSALSKPLNLNVLNYRELRTAGSFKGHLKIFTSKGIRCSSERCVPNNNTPGHLSLFRNAFPDLISSDVLKTPQSSQAGQVLPAPVCRWRNTSSESLHFIELLSNRNKIIPGFFLLYRKPCGSAQPCGFGGQAPSGQLPRKKNPKLGMQTAQGGAYQTLPSVWAQMRCCLGLSFSLYQTGTRLCAEMMAFCKSQTRWCQGELLSEMAHQLYRGLGMVWIVRHAIAIRNSCFAGWISQVVQVVKNPPANAGDVRDSRLLPGSGKSHGQRSLTGCSP